MAKRAKQSTAAKTTSINSLQRSGANVVNAATTIIGRTLSGAEDVGREVGVTAIAAARGSMRAAEQIGGDLMEVTKAALEGTLEAAERIGTAATRAVRNIVTVNGAPRRAGATTAPRRRGRGRPRKTASSPRGTAAAL